MSSLSEITGSWFSRFYRLTIVIGSCVLGASIVIVLPIVRPSLPWAVYVIGGIVGGILGTRIGRKIYWALSTQPTRCLSNFEYQRLLRTMRFWRILEYLLGCLVGGVIGGVVFVMTR